MGSVSSRRRLVAVTTLSFGEITELAQAHGWVDTFGSAEEGNWTPSEADF